MIVIGEDLVEGPDGGVCHQNIAGRDNIFETVPMPLVSVFLLV